jgi:CRISPR-associated protein Csb2
MSTARAGDVVVDAPREGRTRALVEAHERLFKAKPPSAAADRLATDEKELPPPLVSTGLGQERYVRAEPASASPWTRCWILPFVDHDQPDRPVNPDERVAFCVALHRALISKFDGDAPALLTGKYANNGVQPANRVSLQVCGRNSHLAGFLPQDLYGEPDARQPQQAFIVALPAGADPLDIGVIERAMGLVTRVTAIGRRLDIEGFGSQGPVVDGGRFWLPPAPDHIRTWSVLPAVVETRGQGDAWSLIDAAMLSVGLVWRDSLVEPAWSDLPSPIRYHDLVAKVKDAGVEVINVRPLRATRCTR